MYTYRVHLPSDLEPDRVYPTIFTLHGRGSDERNMFGVAAPLADSFIIVGIQGDLPLGAGYQYYELKGLGNPIREQFDQALRQLESFIEEMMGNYPIDPVKRYLLGFSQGAILAMSLAHTMGDRLKGIAAMNGYVPEFVKTEQMAPSNLKPISMFISHGEYDSVFPIRIGHETAKYFQGLTSSVTFRSYPTDHGVSAENQRDLASWFHEDAGLSHLRKEE